MLYRSHLAGFVIVLAVSAAPGGAQTPSGAVAGFVTDPTGAMAPAIAIIVTDLSTSQSWNTVTDDEGYFHVAALAPGSYRLVVQSAGFKRVEQPAVVEVGVTTIIDVTLALGDVTEIVVVDGAVPILRRDHHQVAGVIGRDQIDALPLNGRHVLELAKLEPGVTAPGRGTNNRTFVEVLGAGLQTNPRVGATRITVDGASVNAPGAIGTNLQISPEAVQEFQLSTASFDVATGMTTNGSINVVTRSGSARTSGGGFFVYRDHHLAAHPGLRRDAHNPDPTFRRHQLAVSLGGPVRHNRVWFFATYEGSDQQGVVAVQPATDEFAPLGGIFLSPAAADQFNVRADAHVADNHRLFARHTGDYARAFAPLNERTDILPSGWARQRTRVQHSVAGASSMAGPTRLNELRLSYYFVDSSEAPATEDDCHGCFGLGAPPVVVAGAGVSLGNSRNLGFVGSRYQLTDTLSWQIGPHGFRFGFDWEHGSTRTSLVAQEPAQLTLWSPSRVRQLAPHIPIPASFATLGDILQLPLQSFQTGLGPAVTPQRDSRPDRVFDLYRVHVSDNWRPSTRLSVNAGAAWTYEPNAWNHDLTKPVLLLPLLGTDRLGAPPIRAGNISATAGFAWTLTRDARTVLRIGVGRYFDPAATSNSISQINERAALSPAGSSRIVVSGNNILWNGAPLNFRNPTPFTGEQLLSILPGIRADLWERINAGNNDRSVRTIDVTKQGMNLSDPAATTPSAVHANVGFERQLTGDLAVSADLVWRWFTNTSMAAVDYNRWNSAAGPVLRACTVEERDDVRAACSNATITFDTTSGRARYNGLLVRVVKRLSNGWQLLGSYALGSFMGSNGTGAGTGFNNDDWLENDGPLPTDRRHIANVSGLLPLPAGVTASFSASVYSAPPLSAYVEGVDFNGDGTSDDLLPGTTVNQFGRGLEADDMRRLVEAYSDRIARRPTAGGTIAPVLTLAPRFQSGDSFVTHDIRVMRSFALGRRNARVTVFTEVFNLFNTANLIGYGENVANTATFGQPGARVSHAFGSGGPRAIQLGARVAF